MATEHGGLKLAGEAKAILKGEQDITIVRPPGTRKERRAAANPVGGPLFEALRALRRDLAAEAQLPPYVIFHDSTLREMAATRPRSLAALGAIPGVGARKLEAYGEAFLREISRH